MDGKTDSVQTVEKGKTVEPYVPEKKFWPAGAIVFRGWYEKDAEDTFDFSTPINDDLRLYAEFSGSYLVKFLDANGKVIASYEYMPGEKVLAYQGEVSPPGTSKLLYWYEQEDGVSVPFAFGTRTANRDMVLVPCFGNQYFIGYFSEGSKVDRAVVSEGEKAPIPADPTRVGYEFKHWSTTLEGDVAFDFDTPITEANTIDGSLALYAAWTPAEAEYTVAYWFEKPNISGNPGNNTDNYAFVSSETKKATAETVVDYTTESASGIDGITIGDIDEDLGDINVKIGDFHHGETQTVKGDGTTVVNVFYSRTMFTFSFNLPLGSNLSFASMTFAGNTYSNTEGGANNQYSFSAKYDQDVENVWPSTWNAEFTTTTKNSASIAFEGWHAEGQQYNSATKRLSVTSDMVPRPGSTSRVFDAVWVTSTVEKEVEYWIEALPDEIADGKAEMKVVDDAEEGLHVEGLYVKNERLSQRYKSASSYLVPKNLEGMESGVAFNNMGENYHELYYKRARYGLTFNSMGGGPVVRNPGKNYGAIMYEEYLSDYEPANPTKTLDGVNYTFTGWYMDAEYFIPVDFDSARMPHSNVELFARWEYERKTVKFYNDLGGVNLGIDQKVEVGARAVAPADYVKGVTVVGNKGIFNGWLFYLFPESTTGIMGYNFNVPVTEDISLYANIKSSGFKVTYTAGAGSGTVPVDPHPEGYVFNTMASARESGGLVPPSGQVFYGWRIQNDTNNRGLILPGATFTITGDMVLVAQYYERNEVTTIAFNANGGSGSMPNQTAIYGQNFTLAANAFTRDSNVFVSWNTQADGSGTSYGNRQAFTPWNIRGGSLTLYAQWTPLSSDTFSVTVEDSYATVTGAGNYAAGANVTVNAGARDGYAFSGWTVKAGGIVISNSATASFVMPAANVVVKANWTQGTGTTYTVTYRPGAHGTFAAHTTSGLKYGDPTPTAPVATGEAGWSFTSWSPAPRATVTGNAIYTALWAEQEAEKTSATMYTVRFIDWDGRLIKTQQVPEGGNATPPPDPVRQGYLFNGWDRDYTNVKANIMVTALYIPDQTNSLVPIDPGNNPSTGEGSELGPFQAAGIPSIMLGSLEVPLWSGNLGHLAWGLANLILCAIGVLLAAMAIFRNVSQRRREREEAMIAYYADGDSGQEKQPGAGWIVTAIVMAVIGIIVFVLTEDMGKIMVLVDNWTIISAIVFLMEVLALTQVFKRQLEDPDDVMPDATHAGGAA
ncbi:MAG: InlB B-repeat-containing protein [Clostridiales bacterium]|nr:InlB B-repeat-containing protein [Clostridiales bacterium]